MPDIVDAQPPEEHGQREERGLDYRHQVEALMEENRERYIVTDQRLTQVETRVTAHETRLTVVEVQQGRLEKAMEKLADVMAVQANKTTLNEAAIIAIKDRTDDHNSQIKAITERQTDMDKLMAGLQPRLNALWGIVAVIGTAVAGAIISHFLHF